MIALRDLDNGNVTKPPSHAVDVCDLNFAEIEFGEEENARIPLTYHGHPLVVKVPAKATMLLNPQPNIKWAVLLQTDAELTTTLGKLIYSALGQAPVVKRLDPRPDFCFGLSRLDQASAEGFAVGYQTWEQLSSQVRCITSTGASTSISCNMQYPATWAVDLSKIIFDSKRVPEDSEADFYVCLPSPTLCITLDSPSKNYGRFSE